MTETELRQGSTPGHRTRASVSDEPVMSVLKPGEIVYDPNNPNDWSEDEAVLAALGYKAEFKREFSLFTTFSVSFAVLGLLPSFASTLYYGLGYAGTAGMTWGWLIAMVGIQCIAMGMAEICSAMPTSGGLYYASAVLAPPGWGPFASWCTGWSNWLAQVTAAPSINYGTASMILAAASIGDDTFVPQNYQVYLLTVLLMIIQSGISSMPTKRIAQFNSYGSTFNMLALIVVIILIPADTDRTSRGLNLSRFNDSSTVWGTIYRGTEWPPGIAILMSFLSVIWTMSGYDSPFHLSEECSNANIASPRAIVLTSSTGGIFGWFLQLVVAYTIVDIDDALNSDVGQPFAAYLQQCMPFRTTMAILALTIIAGFSMGQGNMVSASRVSFAYARDGCFPMSRFWARVNGVTHTPVNAVMGNCAIGILLLLLIFAGEYAIGAIFSVGAIGAFVSFSLPIAFRLTSARKRFRTGPWNLGRYSLPIGSIGLSFVIVMVPIMCFPYSRVGYNDDPIGPLNAQAMNWTCLVYGGPMLFAIFWWFVDARKWFKGPRVNLEHALQYDKTQDIEQIQGREGEDGSGSGSAGSDEEGAKAKGA